ncbi:hypothetical protein TRAPUB_6075 [Trametes pubescens]|uniref:Uncharacterized protein n=1 Tax=Trametes pubescens TaxID=154538 RepID=A0A1M2V6X6_TRAPU|nr:hypothetical protein TRAPUB_6075 [Trametes pubescens]
MTVANLDCITTPPHWSTHMVFGSYGDVRKFGLRGCHFSSFNTLHRMLSALPLLEQLSMQEIGWPPNRAHVLKGPENGFPRPALECLVFSGQSAGDSRHPGPLRFRVKIGDNTDTQEGP